MFISELIVGLWFVPVVLFIALPLSVFCVWSVFSVCKKIGDKVVQVHGSVEERETSPASGLHTKPAV